MVPIDDTALYMTDTGGRGCPVVYLNGADADQLPSRSGRAVESCTPLKRHAALRWPGRLVVVARARTPGSSHSRRHGSKQRLVCGEHQVRERLGGDVRMASPCRSDVFRRWPDGAVRLHWASELIHEMPDPGQDPRHSGRSNHSGPCSTSRLPDARRATSRWPIPAVTVRATTRGHCLAQLGSLQSNAHRSWNLPVLRFLPIVRREGGRGIQRRRLIAASFLPDYIFLHVARIFKTVSSPRGPVVSPVPWRSQRPCSSGC